MLDLLESSSTFRGIHEEGERVGLRKVLIRMATKRFGPPSPTTVAVAFVDGIEDIELLQNLIERVVNTEGWSEVVPIEWRSTELEGVVHGRMVELDDKKALPKGVRVRISVATLAEPETLGEQHGNSKSTAADVPEDLAIKQKRKRPEKPKQ